MFNKVLNYQKKMDCPLCGREFGEDGASNGMGLDCLPGGRELGEYGTSNGTFFFDKLMFY